MPATQTLVLSGYYGFDNAGDEAILLSILQQLEKQDIEAVVLSGSPEKTTALYGTKAVNRMDIPAVIRAIQQCDGVISGGGSLLQDVKSPKSVLYYLGIIQLAKFLRKPVFFYAQGVGPISRKWLYPLIQKSLNMCYHISVRDKESQKFLQSIGVSDVLLAADPVLGLTVDKSLPLPPSISEFLENRPIALSLRPWTDNPWIVEKATEMVRELIGQGHSVLLLPLHHEQDVEILAKVKEEFSESDLVRLIENPMSVPELVQVIHNCRLVIGMRLHALVFAASQHVPFVGISYDPKIDAFMELFHKQASTDITYWHSANVLQDAFRTLQEQTVAIDTIKKQTSALQDRVDIPAKEIKHFFQRAPLQEATHD